MSSRDTRNDLLFYTYHDYMDYPYVLRNIHQKPKQNYFHEIVDIGIYDLTKPPYIHSEEKLEQWKKMDLGNKGWKVVPDCPDIRREYGLDEFQKDNVEYSKELVQKYFNPADPTQLPVVQGYYDDHLSFREYCKWLKREYPNHGFDKIGIGTICKSGNVDEVEKIVKIAKREFPNAWFHAFGLRMNHLNRVYKYISSWDSQSWNFPRGRGRSSVKATDKSYKENKIDYFVEYLETINKYTDRDYDFSYEKSNGSFRFVKLQTSMEEWF